MRVFEYVRDGHRFGLALTRDDAARDIGSAGLPLYEIREIEIAVVFLLVDDPDGYDRNVLTNSAYSTYEKASAARVKDQAIEIAALV